MARLRSVSRLVLFVKPCEEWVIRVFCLDCVSKTYIGATAPCVHAPSSGQRLRHLCLHRLTCTRWISLTLAQNGLETRVATGTANVFVFRELNYSDECKSRFLET